MEEKNPVVSQVEPSTKLPTSPATVLVTSPGFSLDRLTEDLKALQDLRGRFASMSYHVITTHVDGGKPVYSVFVSPEQAADYLGKLEGEHWSMVLFGNLWQVRERPYSHICSPDGTKHYPIGKIEEEIVGPVGRVGHRRPVVED